MQARSALTTVYSLFHSHSSLSCESQNFLESHELEKFSHWWWKRIFFPSLTSENFNIAAVCNIFSGKKLKLHLFASSRVGRKFNFSLYQCSMCWNGCDDDEKVSFFCETFVVIWRRNCERKNDDEDIRLPNDSNHNNLNNVERFSWKKLTIFFTFATINETWWYNHLNSLWRWSLLGHSFIIWGSSLLVWGGQGRIK